MAGHSTQTEDSNNYKGKFRVGYGVPSQLVISNKPREEKMGRKICGSVKGFHLGHFSFTISASLWIWSIQLDRSNCDIISE